MPISIRSRLLLLVMSVLLPGLLGMVWLVGNTLENERLAHQRTLQNSSRALSLVIDGVLSQRLAVARTLAGSRWLDHGPDVAAEDIERFRTLAEHSMETLEGWVELRAAGRTLMDTRKPAGTPVRLPANDNGDLVESPYVRHLWLSPGGGGHAAVVQPVNRGGHTTMNVVVTVLPAEMQATIEAQPIPQGWIATVLDGQGLVVARLPGGAANVGRRDVPDLASRLAVSKEGLYESVAGDTGISMTGYYNTSPLGWTYLIRMPTEEYAGFLPQAVLQLGLAALVLLALAVAGAFWVSRRIVEPVQSLKSMATRIQAGQGVARASTGITEFDAVGAALADAADALQRNRRELERQVDEAVQRTRLAEQRASQSQRIEALGRLTGGVAHDFNNLLGVINNSAHLIQRHAHTPEVEVPVAATLRAVEVGSRLTQHLLRFSGRRPVRPQSLALAAHLPEVADLLRSVLGHHVEVSVKVAPDTLPVRVDSSELELVLINLALNARDAMPSGGELQIGADNAGPIEAEGLPAAPGRRYVMITVSDNGMGLDAALAERVFEPFFTTKAVGQGTGLGLSQVHGFCTQAGGTARLASTPGLGTTVSLLLPAWDKHGAEAGAALPSTGPVDLRGRRVLVVDDNQELARVTAALLRAHGARVEIAQDAGEALRQVDSLPAFDVVLSDVVMPGEMDGVTLAQRLRDERPSLPVVLTSGYNTGATTTGFVVLHKPTSEAELLRTLHDAIGDVSQAAPATR